MAIATRQPRTVETVQALTSYRIWAALRKFVLTKPLGAAGAVVILALVFGPPLLVLAPAPVLSGWARVELGDHDPAQVVAGMAIGAATAAAVFTGLR